MSDGVNEDRSNDKSTQERHVLVWGGAVQLPGIICTPDDARALIVFPTIGKGGPEQIQHGLNELIDAHRRAGLATLSVSLLTPEDEVLDASTGYFRENISVLHQRVLGVMDWLLYESATQGYNTGYLGVGVSAAAILAAAAMRPDAIRVVVAIDPRLDLVEMYLPQLIAQTLLINAEKDTQAVNMSRSALPKFASATTLDIVRQARQRNLTQTLETIPGVSHVFENNRSLHEVEELAFKWFERFM